MMERKLLISTGQQFLFELSAWSCYQHCMLTKSDVIGYTQLRIWRVCAQLDYLLLSDKQKTGDPGQIPDKNRGIYVINWDCDETNYRTKCRHLKH